MIQETERNRIISLIRKEVVPAIGCTEPMAVALCVAKAKEILGSVPEKIELHLSANILKNAMGAGIPGTDMVGLNIAIALGAKTGKSIYGLEVLKDGTDKDVIECKQYVKENRIKISRKEEITEMLYIEAICTTGVDSSRVIISGGHANFVYASINDTVLFNKKETQSDDAQEELYDLDLRKVYDFATTSPLEEITFILESAKMNKIAAERSFAGDYGHALGKTLHKATRPQLIMGDNTHSRILSYTSAACDARMAGAMISVMSNSGSGNQGISATLPVVIFAEEHHKTEEELTRALMISHLLVIYIKQSLGRLSALCGCVVAATGASAGITWLMGGKYDQVSYAVKNMIANLAGMLCDGAKPSCSFKVTTGASTAVLSAIMAMEGRYVTSAEGIIEEDVDQCIRNLTRINAQGMCETDRLVLNIMTNKC